MMSLGRIYHKLLVAAGAVAVLFANWFCRPPWRRRLPDRQGTEAVPPEQQKLLPDNNEASGHFTDVDTLDAAASLYQAPGVPVEEAAQASASALVSSEEITLLAPEEPSDRPMEGAPAGPLMALAESTPADAPAGSQQSAVPPKDQPAQEPEEQPVGGATDGSTATPADPVDEAYLRSLMEGFPPPKFKTVKPAGESIVDYASLGRLIEEELGPPRFGVQKPSGPSSAEGPAAAPVDAVSAPVASAASANNDATASAAAAPPAADSAAKAATGTGGSARTSGCLLKRGLPAEEEGAGQGTSDRMVLTLDVTHGPAAGRRFVADDPAKEYKVGRLPDCSFQILDQEISGRHASFRWDQDERKWKLHDVGSLNGTCVGGAAIGKDYKVPGPEHALADGDNVDFGSATRCRVSIKAAAEHGLASAAAKRMHLDRAQDFLSGAAATSGLPTASIIGIAPPTDRSPSAWDKMSLAGLLSPPPQIAEFPSLGARLCVHNRLGMDHKRTNHGCEDVPHWELPFAPYEGAGLLAVFDGHHGSKAATQAKEHVPAVLRNKLLQRDGRAAPPLPALPPPPPPSGAEEDSGDAASPSGQQGHGGAGQAEAGGAAAGPSSQESTVGCRGSGDGAQTSAGSGYQQPQAPPQQELLPPPPPDGPPLPALLHGRELASQRALLKDAFLTADQYMSKEEGCTATVVLLEASKQEGWLVQSANVGDSSALLINFTRGTWAKLSEDHRIASSVSERQRLAARGHTVRTRLYGLNISRMLGDRFLKEEDLGFLAEPHVSRLAGVGPGEAGVLVLASDGLWDVLPEERAARMILQEAAKLADSGSAAPPPFLTAPLQPPPPPAALSCRTVADLLLAQALVLRSKDDITIAVLEVGPHLVAAAGAAQQAPGEGAAA